MAEVEETIQRLSKQKGVVGVVIMDREGRPIRSTFDQQTTTQYAAAVLQLAEKSGSVVKEMDNTNDLSFVRLRTRKHEIMIAPDKDYIMAVVQNPEKN